MSDLDSEPGEAAGRQGAGFIDARWLGAEWGEHVGDGTGAAHPCRA